MLETRSLPDAVEALVWKFALSLYHTSATRVRHRRVVGHITRAAYEMDRGRHFARNTVTGKWFYAPWCNSTIREADVDMLQPTSFSVLEKDHGMATPHEPAPSEGEYDCYYCDGSVFYCARCDEPYCAACEPDGCLAP
jgi:hypothetical protein